MTEGHRGTVGTIALAGAGLAMLVVGAQHLLAPQMMMATPGIELSSINHYHIIRAGYGGAFLGIAALFLSGLVRPAQRGFALLAVVMLFGGFALGRVVSLALDGVPVGRYLAVLAFEVTFAALALLALRRGA
jgi:hypothetical protein